MAYLAIRGRTDPAAGRPFQRSWGRAGKSNSGGTRDEWRPDATSARACYRLIDGSHQAGLTGLAGQIRGAPAGRRQVMRGGEFTGPSRSQALCMEVHSTRLDRVAPQTEHTSMRVNEGRGMVSDRKSVV